MIAAWLLNKKFLCAAQCVAQQRLFESRGMVFSKFIVNASLYQMYVLIIPSGSDQASKDSAALPMVIYNFS